MTGIATGVIDRNFLSFVDQLVGEKAQLLVFRILEAVFDEPDASVRAARVVDESRQVAVFERVDGVVAVVGSVVNVQVEEVSGLQARIRFVLSDQLANVLGDKASFGDFGHRLDAPSAVLGLEDAQRDFLLSLGQSVDALLAALAHLAALDDRLALVQSHQDPAALPLLVCERQVLQLGAAIGILAAISALASGDWRWIDDVQFVRQEVLRDVLEVRWIVEVLFVLDRHHHVLHVVDFLQKLVVQLALYLVELEEMILEHELLKLLLILLIRRQQVEESLINLELEWVERLDLKHR